MVTKHTKKGKNKKQIAWAVASSFVKVRHVKKAAKVLNLVSKKNKQPFVPAEYWSRKAPMVSTPNSKITHYRYYNGKKKNLLSYMIDMADKNIE